MKELIEKISSYNLFNYLFPGIIFVVLLEKFTEYNLIQTNLFLGAFFYYFIGLIISRVGSLLIEPILRKTTFIKFADYSKFITASKKDIKVELFSEINNMYRTLLALIFTLLGFKLYELLESNFPNINLFTPYIVLLIMIIIFVLSYKKQTKYIVKRCNLIK